MVSRLKLVKNLIFYKKFIRISLVIIRMKTEGIKNKLNCENIDNVNIKSVLLYAVFLIK